MARQNCPYQTQSRRPLYERPVPLYDLVAPEEEAVPAATAVSVKSDRRAALEDAEMTIRRQNQLPAPATAAECEALALLRQQNELLAEILGALSAQVALRLNCER